jgi:signal transduction histidine kinase
MNTRILVIDDNCSIHEDFRKVFGGLYHEGSAEIEAAFFGDKLPEIVPPDFHVDYALQGADGVEVFHAAHASGAPHAVAFLDVRMPPGMDGIETAQRLWEIDPDLQIVICSAYTDYSWEEMAARLGYQDRLLILKKPFAGIEVLQLACALTSKWELRRQANLRLQEVEQQVEIRTAALVATNDRLEAEIEQRKSAEEQLLRSQRLESVGALASGIAHDLNNLLSPIMMSAQLLEDDTLRPEQEALLDMIETATVRAAKIVSQLLTFARGTADERTVLQAGSLLRDMSKIISETFPPGIQVQCHISPEVRLLHGNPTQLHQVLMNLCVNARDAMPDGGTIRLEADNFIADESYASAHPDAHAGRYVLLRVSDTGPGIPMAIRGRIFEPFFTTKEPGRGTGLGLSTVNGIVRNHGGFVEVKSAPDQGTTFLIYLPAALAHDAAPASAPEAAAPAGRGELVLVVDDESVIREATAATLIRHGYRAITAGDGAEAITTYAQYASQIDLVLTDVQMPFVDGLAFTRALKNITPQIRVVLTTGSSDEGRLREFHSLGVYDLLPKPFHAAQLLTTLQRALSRQAGQKATAAT